MLSKLTQAVALLIGAVQGHGEYCGPGEMRYINQFGHQECLVCPQYTRSYWDGSTCLGDVCPSGQILLIDGTCAPDVYTQQVAAQPVYYTNFRSVYCPSYQIYSADGLGCQSCSDFTRPTADQSYCHYDQCDYLSKQTLDGRCELCPSGYQASVDRHSCVRTYVPPTCNSRQIYSNDGTYCIQCQDYTRAQNSNTVCAANGCLPYEYVTADGTCRTCEAGHMAMNPSSHHCNAYLSPTCNSRQIYSQDGRDCITCPAYSRPQDGGRFCSPDNCKLDQVIDRIGQCVTCPTGTRPDSRRIECILRVVAPPPPPPNCGLLAIYSRDGRSCVRCPEYTKANSNNSACEPDDCRSDYLYIGRDGYCSKCPFQFISTADNTACIPRYITWAQDPVGCDGSREIYAEDFKSCVNCGDFEVAMDFNSRCAQPQCAERFILKQDGSCEPCTEGQVADATGRACVAAPEVVEPPAEGTR